MLFLLISVIFLFSAPPKPDFRINDFSVAQPKYSNSIGTTNAYFLEGFDFAGYNSTYPSMTAMTEAEVNAVISGKKQDCKTIKQSPTSYGIVGYSQGGLRALAFATHLKNSKPAAEYNKLKAVVTMSGIDQGMQALQDDLPGIKSRIMSQVNILTNGLRATSGVTSAIGFPIVTTVLVTGVKFSELINSPASQMTVDIITKFLPSEFQGYVVPAMLGKDKPAKDKGYQQLDDMRPRSGYMKNYVADNVPSSYKVQT